MKNELNEFVFAYLSSEEIEVCGGIGPETLRIAEAKDQDMASDIISAYLQSLVPQSPPELPPDLAREWAILDQSQLCT